LPRSVDGGPFVTGGEKMKVYLISLGAGVLVGVIYGLISVRSPAPPAIALIGLLGMLLGEQVVPIAKRVASGEPVSLSWFCKQCAPQITGVQANAAATAAHGALDQAGIPPVTGSKK
jgi:XapX domain-containing protein